MALVSENDISLGEVIEGHDVIPISWRDRGVVAWAKRMAGTGAFALWHPNEAYAAVAQAMPKGIIAENGLRRESAGRLSLHEAFFDGWTSSAHANDRVS